MYLFNYEDGGYVRPSIYDYDSDMVYDSLTDYKPVYTRGTRSSPTGLSGHAWVVDGYKKYSWLVVLTGNHFDEYKNFNGSLTTQIRSTDLYYHCNFGWDGTANGYYSDGVFDLNYPYEITGHPTPMNRNYEFNLQILPDITKR